MCELSEPIQAIICLIVLTLGTFGLVFFNWLFIKIMDFIILEIEAHRYGKDFPFNIKEINRRLK